MNVPGPLEFGCTRAVRRMLSAVCRREGRQAVLLAWPAGATYLPVHDFVPGEYDVILSHVSGCPVYVDARRAALFRDQPVVLDAATCSWSRPRPMLAVRHEREAN